MPHGDAVALDSFLTANIAQQRGLISLQVMKKIETVYARHGLPACHPMLQSRVIRLALDKVTVHRDGQLRAPLPCRGAKVRLVYTNSMTDKEISQSVAYAQSFAKLYPQCLFVAGINFKSSL